MDERRTATRITTEPVCEPVTLAEAKDWAHIESDDTSQDAVITGLIRAMRRYAENYTLRAFIPRDLQKIQPDWGCGRIELPFAPLISVSSITYVDVAGTVQTLSPSLYVVYPDFEPGFVAPAYLQIWPPIRCVPDAVRINYTAGYTPVGSPTDDDARRAGVPEELKLWMKARLATLFENREQLILNNQIEIPRHFADGVLDGLVMGCRIA